MDPSSLIFIGVSADAVVKLIVEESLWIPPLPSLDVPRPRHRLVVRHRPLLRPLLALLVGAIEAGEDRPLEEEVSLLRRSWIPPQIGHA